MRIYLKERVQKGQILYPKSGFYEAREDHALEFIEAEIAYKATEHNKILVYIDSKEPYAIEPDSLQVEKHFVSYEAKEEADKAELDKEMEPQLSFEFIEEEDNSGDIVE